MRIKLFFLLSLFIIISKADDQSPCGCSTQSRSSFTSVIEEIKNVESIEISRTYIKEDMVLIEQREGFVGSDNPVIFSDGETPKRRVELDSYYIDRFQVSNQGILIYLFNYTQFNLLFFSKISINLSKRQDT